MRSLLAVPFLWRSAEQQARLSALMNSSQRKRKKKRKKKLSRSSFSRTRCSHMGPRSAAPHDVSSFLSLTVSCSVSWCCLRCTSDLDSTGRSLPARFRIQYVLGFSGYCSCVSLLHIFST